MYVCICVYKCIIDFIKTLYHYICAANTDNSEQPVLW